MMAKMRTWKCYDAVSYDLARASLVALVALGWTSLVSERTGIGVARGEYGATKKMEKCVSLEVVSVLHQRVIFSVGRVRMLAKEDCKIQNERTQKTEKGCSR